MLAWQNRWINMPCFFTERLQSNVKWGGDFYWENVFEAAKINKKWKINPSHMLVVFLFVTRVRSSSFYWISSQWLHCQISCQNRPQNLSKRRRSGFVREKAIYSVECLEKYCRKSNCGQTVLCLWWSVHEIGKYHQDPLIHSEKKLSVISPKIRRKKKLSVIFSPKILYFSLENAWKIATSVCNGSCVCFSNYKRFWVHIGHQIVCGSEISACSAFKSGGKSGKRL